MINLKIENDEYNINIILSNDLDSYQPVEIGILTKIEELLALADTYQHVDISIKKSTPCVRIEDIWSSNP